MILEVSHKQGDQFRCDVGEQRVEGAHQAGVKRQEVGSEGRGGEGGSE